MPSAAIITPIVYNDDKSKSESISTMSGGQFFKSKRTFFFCFVRDILLPLLPPRWSLQGCAVLLLTFRLRQDVTVSNSTKVIVCFDLVKKKKTVIFPVSTQTIVEDISTVTCPGSCSLGRPTGVRINTSRTWRPHSHSHPPPHPHPLPPPSYDTPQCLTKLWPKTIQE